MLWQKSNCYKTSIVTKLQLLQNSKCDKTQIVTKLKNSNCDKTKKNQIATKLKNLNCDETKIMSNINWWQKILLIGLLVRTFWHLDNRWDVLWAAFCNSRNVFIFGIQAIKIDNPNILQLFSTIRWTLLI